VCALPSLWALDLSDRQTVPKLVSKAANLRHLRASGDDNGLKTASDLEPLASLPLESLDLSARSRSKLTAAALKPVLGMTSLRALAVRGIALGDATTKRLPPLERLVLGDPKMKLGDAGIANLAKVTTLRSLAITQTGAASIGDGAVAALVALSNLEELTVSARGVSIATFEALARLPALRRLCLQIPQPLEDAWLVALASASKLEVLETYEHTSLAKITERGLDALAKSASLRVFNVQEFDKTPISTSAAATLRARCVVTTSGEPMQRLVQPEMWWWQWPFGD
jgi:hypothetical protein